MTSFQSDAGFDRRSMLQAAGLLLGAFSLPDLLRLRALGADHSAEPGSQASSETAVIFVILGGGPSQHETYDPKPEAPVEYRGIFNPIATRLPGEHFCELLPRQAALADQLTVIRSIHHEQASHIAMHIVETGYDLRSSTNTLKGEMPCIGSVVSRVRGRNASGIPGAVSLPKPFAYVDPHWLGAQYNFFSVRDDPSKPDFKVDNLEPAKGLTVERLAQRNTLRESLESPQPVLDLRQSAQAVDQFAEQAFDLVTGDQAQRAFDLGKEKDATRDAYGRNEFGQRLLLARRLVEAGVPFVRVFTGAWDDHVKLNEKMPPRCAEYDQGVATLIEDLQQRGLAKSVLVVAMGEFGRTPRVNVNAGRDHWPRVHSMMLAGGKYNHGQVIGATDDRGGTVVAAPYRPQNVLGMVYRHLGIDPATTFLDYSGRPRYLLEERRPISELL